MQVDREDLRRRIAAHTADELRVIAVSPDYTEEARAAAANELERRQRHPEREPPVYVPEPPPPPKPPSWWSTLPGLLRTALILGPLALAGTIALTIAAALHGDLREATLQAALAFVLCVLLIGIWKELPYVRFVLIAFFAGGLASSLAPLAIGDTALNWSTVCFYAFGLFEILFSSDVARYYDGLADRQRGFAPA